MGWAAVFPALLLAFCRELLDEVLGLLWVRLSFVVAGVASLLLSDGFVLLPNLTLHQEHRERSSAGCGCKWDAHYRARAVHANNDGC